MKDEPPIIDGYQMEPSTPLHQLAKKRIRLGRDLKLIITAEDSETGVGKTTCAGWLALTWTKQFAGMDWFVSPDRYGEGMATLNPKEYFKILSRIPGEYGAGTTVIVDDAEELDARRSMQNLNVEFSQRWMLMRLKQAITIITLPSPSSIDSRIEELADVWINIHARGQGTVHDIRVQSYGQRKVMTKKAMEMQFPDVSGHPELEKLQSMKEDKMDEWDHEEDAEAEDTPDPDEVKRETIIELAQEMRNNGKTAKEIANHIPYGEQWVYKYTESQDGGKTAKA